MTDNTATHYSEVELERIREAATLLLDRARDGSVEELTSAVQRASEALKLPLDLKRGEAEVNKLERENLTARTRERSERIGAMVSLVTPVLSVIALAATLSFQTWQFRQTEQAQREAADEAAWKSAREMLSQRAHFSPEVIALQPFFHSPRHRDEARELVVRLLAETTDTSVFDDLFQGLFVPIDWNNVDSVLRLDEELAKYAHEVYNKAWEKREGFKGLSDAEKRTYDYALYVTPKLCSALGPLLRSSRPTGQAVDLSNTLFDGCDWSGANLHGARIVRMSLEGVDLTGADLGAIEDFNSANFDKTAWWEAKILSPSLLAYLRSQYPCDSNVVYGPRHYSPNTAECAKANMRPADTTK